MAVVWLKSIAHAAVRGRAMHTLSKRSLKLDSLSDNACNAGQAAQTQKYTKRFAANIAERDAWWIYKF
jgi:hypothetical protein